MAQKGKRVKVKGLTLFVKEYGHAYLVRGPGLGLALTIPIGRLAVFEFLGRKKWTKVAAMPCRPLYTSGLDAEPCAAIAFYFNIGPPCEEPCRRCAVEPENRYKP